MSKGWTASRRHKQSLLMKKIRREQIEALARLQQSNGSHPVPQQMVFTEDELISAIKFTLQMVRAFKK